jgi:hypothetical protein
MHETCGVRPDGLAPHASLRHELTPHHHHDLAVATGKAQLDLGLDELTANGLGVVQKGLPRLGTSGRQRARNGVFEGFNNCRSVLFVCVAWEGCECRSVCVAGLVGIALTGL